MTAYLTVSTTADTAETAADLAQVAVDARLAASAQVTGPVRSFFWHDGVRGEGEEWIVSFKTTESGYPALEALLKEQHPWDNPEISAVPLVAASASYLAWLENTVNGS